MLPKSLWRAAFLACAALTPAIRADDANPPGQSTFISPGNNVAFAFTVPNDNDNPRSTFFSIRVPKKYTWGGVGLGSDDMKGALFLIIYQNGDGTNVTFSPRIAHGNYEPFFFRDMRWTVIPNQTGIIDDYMIFTAMCTESCRTWPGGDTTGGYIDVSSPAQPAIYAVGPEGTLKDDSPSAGLMYHQEYGVFNIDMRRTRGAADAPVLGKDTKLDGTVQISSVTTKGDLKAALHAAFMIFSIIALMGFGGIWLLPAVGLAKWHALNQIVATMGVLGGLFLGVLASFNYQRSRSFKHYHQVLGYIIVAFILAQLGLGVQHHFKHQRTKAPTIFGKIHVWLGRLILLLAAINGIIGFTFALKGTSAIVFGVFIIIFTVAAVLLRLRYFPIKRQTLGAQQSHSWRQSSGYNAGYPSRPPPGYEPPSQQVGLQATGSSSKNSPWKSGDDRDCDDDEPQLANAQRPREFA